MEGDGRKGSKKRFLMPNPRTDEARYFREIRESFCFLIREEVSQTLVLPEPLFSEPYYQIDVPKSPLLLTTGRRQSGPPAIATPHYSASLNLNF